MENQDIRCQLFEGSLRLTQAGTVGGQSVILFTPEQVDQLIENLTIAKQEWEAEIKASESTR